MRTKQVYCHIILILCSYENDKTGENALIEECQLHVDNELNHWPC